MASFLLLTIFLINSNSDIIFSMTTLLLLVADPSAYPLRRALQWLRPFVKRAFPHFVRLRRTCIFPSKASNGVKNFLTDLRLGRHLHATTCTSIDFSQWLCVNFSPGLSSPKIRSAPLRLFPDAGTFLLPGNEIFIHKLSSLSNLIQLRVMKKVRELGTRHQL